MTELFPDRLFDRELLRRAFESADSGGEAALNGLLYGSGALLASSVLLVTTDPPLLGVILATIPWLGLAVGIWWWIGPAVRDQLVLDKRGAREAYLERSAAADVLLNDASSDEDRRLAAERLLDGKFSD